MTAEQFTYWLQGFSELNEGKMPTEAQWEAIQDHLKTVFVKVTPAFPSHPSLLMRDFPQTPLTITC